LTENNFKTEDGIVINTKISDSISSIMITSPNGKSTTYNINSLSTSTKITKTSALNPDLTPISSNEIDKRALGIGLGISIPIALGALALCYIVNNKNSRKILNSGTSSISMFDERNETPPPIPEDNASSRQNNNSRNAIDNHDNLVILSGEADDNQNTARHVILKPGLNPKSISDDPRLASTRFVLPLPVNPQNNLSGSDAISPDQNLPNLCLPILSGSDAISPDQSLSSSKLRPLPIPLPKLDTRLTPIGHHNQGQGNVQR